MHIAFPHTTLLSLTSPEVVDAANRSRIDIHPARRRVPKLPAGCEGFQVIGPQGRVGTVELVRRLHGHEELVIVSGLFVRHRYLASAADVESVDVPRRRIRLRYAPVPTVDDMRLPSDASI